MESCSICCFPYSEVESNDVNCKSKKELCCNHCLCQSCYIRLDRPQCPFCRSQFKYSNEDIKKRKQLNLEYYKWQPPSQITNYIPHTIDSIPRVLVSDDEVRVPVEPFSRVRKNMHRRRRRDLSFEEVLERRQMIRKRCKRKWQYREERLNKEGHLYTDNELNEVF